MPLAHRRNQSPDTPGSCPLTECMAIIGGAWTPNVIWCLRAGARRFNELRSDIPPISAKVLTTRLRELESRGVVVRQVMPTSPPSVEYSLSNLGAELIPAIDAIVQVGHRLKKRRRNPHRQGRSGRLSTVTGTTSEQVDKLAKGKRIEKILRPEPPE